MPQDLLKRLAILKRNPDLAKILPQDELVSMMSDFVAAFEALKKAVETNKLKGDKGDPGVTPQAGKDYPTKEQIDATLESALTRFTQSFTRFETQAEEAIARASQLRDGKDAEITDELKQEIARLATELISFPEYDDTDLIEKVDLAVLDNEELRDEFNTLRDQLIGAVQSIGNGVGKNQVYGWIRQAVLDGTIPSGSGTGIVETIVAGTGITVDNTDPANPVVSATGTGSGHIIEDEGTPLTQRDTLNFVGAGVTVTDSGTKTVVTISGAGSGAVDSVNGQTGVVVLDADDIDDTSTTHKFTTASDISKLAGIEAGAEVNNISDTNATDLTDGGETTLHIHDSRYYTETEVDTLLSGKAATSHTHTASQITDFDTEVSNNTDVAANTAARHAALTVTDSAEIDFTLTGQDLTASLKAGSIDETKLDASVNASLDLADSASQPGHTHTAANITDFTEAAQDAAGAMVGTSIVYNDAGPTLQRAALTGAITASQDSNSTSLGSFTKAQLDTAVSDGNVLYVGDITQYTDELAQDAVGGMVDTTLVYNDATPSLSRAALTGAVTASAGSNTTALGSFTKSQLSTAVSDGDVLFVGDVTSNATHTGEVTGSTALTVDKTAITNKTLVTAAVGDQVLIADASDTDNLKRVTVQTIVDLASGGGNTYFNNEYIDQSGGTSDTYGVLAGSINGSNTVFTVSQGVYQTGTLKVYLNGKLMLQGTGAGWTETTPASGTFTLVDAPISGDELTVTYQTQTLSTDTVLVRADVDDTPVNGATDVPVSSNWAYDTGVTLATKVGYTTTTTTSSATPTPTGDAQRNELIVTALAENATIAAPTGTATAGNMLKLVITATGATRTVGYNAALTAGNVTRTTSVPAGETLVQVYQYQNAQWVCHYDDIN